MNAKIQTLKGFRDFLPTEKRARDFVAGKIKSTFERFGFEPLETPTLEYADLLLGKYGTEADKLVYTFEDKGDRKVGLRYDQTVPTARVLAQYQNELPRYFRRYQIQNNFRAEKPQSGRYREFSQCDIDIFGSKDPLSDAEILACTYASFIDLGFSQVKLVVNDRQTLFQTLEPFATDTVSVFSIIQSVDKLDKLEADSVIQELMAKGLTQEQSQAALAAIQSARPSENLQSILKLVAQLGVNKSSLIFNPLIARGLDYYTGMIVEIQIPIEGFSVGSFGGGGRYDNLISQIGGPDIPAVGIAFGLDRTVEAALKLDLIPTLTSTATLLVSIFNQNTIERSLNTASLLRTNGIATEIYPSPDKLPKQFKLANQKSIPFVLVIGPDELEKQVVTLKNMKSGEQITDTLEKVITFLQSAI